MYAVAFLEQQREIWKTKVLLTIIMGACLAVTVKGVIIL